MAYFETALQDQLPHVITELRIGPQDTASNVRVIFVYVSPTCPHCGTVVVEEIPKLIRMYKNCRIVIRFLISRPGDIFILKLIWNKTHDVGRYFLIYQNLMKRMMATIKHVTPRDEETLKQKLNGKQWTILSNGNMTKLAVVASEFGFTPDEIEEAIPKTDGLVERQMLDARMIYLSNIAENTDTKEIDVPVVVYDKKCYPDLSSAAAATQ